MIAMILRERFDRGSHMTRWWREMDSNPRSPARETTLRDCLLIEEVRFAADSLLEGRVTCKLVSEIEFASCAKRRSIAQGTGNDFGALKRLFRARRPENGGFILFGGS